MSAPAESTASSAVRRALHELRPQERQEVFLASRADIAVMGGSAFGGKTFSLLMDALRWKDLPAFSVAYFRRTMKQADNPGGLWDESVGLYSAFGAEPFVGSHEHRFPSGMTVRMAGMEHANDRFAWDGAQIPVIYFDQLEHFEWVQFWYMLSRNRDPSGRIRPYIRATCNPDPDSWLAGFLSWWIDQETGYAIPERAGVVRWFVRLGDDSLAWGASREELLTMGHGDPNLPVDHPEQPWLSATFVPASIYDNPLGMARDPGYLGKLRAMGKVERERLLGDRKFGGNWKVRAAAGLMFRREWCPVLEQAPGANELEAVVRAWDLAATEKREGTDPAWTSGVLMGRYKRPFGSTRQRWVILGNARGQLSAAKVERLVKETAAADGKEVRVRVPQDPGQAGKDQAERFISMLAGWDARARLETGDKETRFNPFSAQAERGNVDVVRGAWNEDYLRSLESFPDGRVKDDADATSAAFDELLRYGGPIDVSAGAASNAEDSMAGAAGAPWNL